MPRITDITVQKRRANRHSVFLDGRFAFGCNRNVLADFGLRVGDELTPEKLAEIEAGGLRQECFDRAVAFLSRRLHGREELRRKVNKNGDYPDATIDAVLSDLERLGYVDDAKFAAARAADAATFRKHGPRRVAAELRRAGVGAADVSAAVSETFDEDDGLATARELARKKAPSLMRLDPQTARRRLAGMLLRRGFEYETVKPVIDEALGAS